MGNFQSYWRMERTPLTVPIEGLSYMDSELLPIQLKLTIYDETTSRSTSDIVSSTFIWLHVKERIVFY